MVVKKKPGVGDVRNDAAIAGDLAVKRHADAIYSISEWERKQYGKGYPERRRQNGFHITAPTISSPNATTSPLSAIVLYACQLLSRVARA